jgi:glucokinase
MRRCARSTRSRRNCWRSCAGAGRTCTAERRAVRGLASSTCTARTRRACRRDDRRPRAGRDIVTRALDGSDRALCRDLERFLGFLGSFAGNLALTLGAQGGVYIGGGIVPRLGDRIAASCFRERFESKGRFRTYLARVPTWVITTPRRCGVAGGADRALDDRLGAGRLRQATPGDRR